MRNTKLKNIYAILVYGHVHIYGHIKEPKYKYWFFADFSLIVSL